MARIVVDPERLRGLSAAFNKEAEHLCDLEGRILHIVADLDWEVREKANIEQSLVSARQIATHICGKTNDLSQTLQVSANDFERADNADVSLGEMPLIGASLALAAMPFATTGLSRIMEFDISTGMDDKSVKGFLDETVPKEHLKNLDYVKYEDPPAKGKEEASAYYSWEKNSSVSKYWDEQARAYFGKSDDQLSEAESTELMEIMCYDAKFCELARECTGHIIVHRQGMFKERSMERTIVHEVGHGVYFNMLSHDQQADWLKLYGETSRSGFVTEYAKTNPFEDFAESYKYYVTDPAGLYNKSPQKYMFLKEHVFSGREYYGKDSIGNDIRDDALRPIERVPDWVWKFLSGSIVEK